MNTANSYQRVSPRRHCAICNKTSWCLYDPGTGIALCTKTESAEYIERFKGYIHHVQPTPNEVVPSAQIETRSPDPISDEEAIARDKLYGFLARHAFCQLTVADRDNLHARGLDDEAIERHGYFAYPDRSRCGQVMRDLEKFAKDNNLTIALWRLPGVEARDREGGGFYNVLVFAHRRGYGALAIPVRDPQGHVIAISLRHRDNEREVNEPRYTWLSSRYARSGAPVHLACPYTLTDTQRLIVTEGFLKANITTGRLGCRVVAVPGISIWRGVLPLLEALEATGAISKKTRIVLAYDQEPGNADVAKEQHKLSQHLTEAGYTVTLMTWNPAEGKGIDDALRNGADIAESTGDPDSGGEGPSTETPPTEDVWDDPIPLPGELPPVAVFDIHLLPDALRGWVWDIAERMQAPPDFSAVAALVAAAAVVGRQVGIHPKRHDDWLVVPNLWGAIVGRPSAMKTPALEAGLKPLDRLVAEAADEHKQAIAEYEAKLMVYKARLAAHEAELKRAAKDGDEGQLAQLAANPPEKPIRPIPHRYSTNDATVEKLGELLMDNPNGVLQFRDELVGWLRNLDKAGHEGDRAFFLESFNGSRGYEVDRIGRGSLYIPALCLSLLGGIQPGPLAAYVYDATSEGSAGNDGLLQRFQLLVWPDESKTVRNIDRWPNTEAKNAAFAVYKRLALLDTAALGAVRPDGDDPSAIPALRFTAAAQEVFDEWHERLRTCLRSDEMSAPLESHLAKYPSLMPSLALLFHLMDNDRTEGGVSVTAAVRATAWCEYLESHARRLYVHAENPGIERTRALFEHIKAGDIEDGTPVRQMYRHHWSHLSTPEEMDDAIKTLDAFGWVRVERPEGRQGRPSAHVRLHPLLTRKHASAAA